LSLKRVEHTVADKVSLSSVRITGLRTPYSKNWPNVNQISLDF